MCVCVYQDSHVDVQRDNFEELVLTFFGEFLGLNMALQACEVHRTTPKALKCDFVSHDFYCCLLWHKYLYLLPKFCAISPFGSLLRTSEGALFLKITP